MNGRWRLAVAASLVAALLAVGVVPAGAQSEADRQRVEGEITSARQQVQEASAEEAKLLAELDASTARKRELDGQVAALDGQIAGVQRNLNAAEGRLAAAESEQRGAETRLAAAQEELAAARRKLQIYAIAAYTGQSQAAQFIQSTLKSGTMEELVAKRSYMRAVGDNQAETIRLDERLRDEVKDLTEALTKVRQEAEVQRDAVAAERTKLQVARDAQAAVQLQVAAEVAHKDELHAEAQARRAEFEADVEELERQSAAIEATLRALAEEQRRAAAAAAAAAAAQPAPAPGDAPGGSAAAAPAPAPAAATASPGAGGLVTPIPGAPITSPFGYRLHPIYGDYRLHTGVDMGASEGTPIRAAGAGTVVSAGWISGYGNATIVDHGNGLATLYAHQSAMLTSGGARVSQGQVIGRVGCTGSCTGPHLHFEVRVNGTPVDPAGYI